MNQLTRLASPLLLFLLLACSSSVAGGGSTGTRMSTAATTLEAESLGGAGTDLLDALRGRVRGMHVRQGSADCPQVSFRGTHSLMGENSAVVYVDGVRATNTCILETLQTSEVDRVEAYSAGVAPRPPYQAHPNGLIIVYMSDGRSE